MRAISLYLFFKKELKFMTNQQKLDLLMENFSQTYTMINLVLDSDYKNKKFNCNSNIDIFGFNYSFVYNIFGIMGNVPKFTIGCKDTFIHFVFLDADFFSKRKEDEPEFFKLPYNENTKKHYASNHYIRLLSINVLNDIKTLQTLNLRIYHFLEYLMDSNLNDLLDNILSINWSTSQLEGVILLENYRREDIEISDFKDILKGISPDLSNKELIDVVLKVIPYRYLMNKSVIERKIEISVALKMREGEDYEIL